MLNSNIKENIYKFVKFHINKYGNKICDFFNMNNKKLHMNIIFNNNLYLLYTDKIAYTLIHTDDVINLLIHNLEYCIFDSVGNIIYYMLKKKKILKPYEENINKLFKIDNWSNIKVYNNYIGINLLLFVNPFDMEYYYIDTYEEIKLIKLKDNEQLYNFIIQTNKLDLTTKNMFDIYIISNKYKHLLVYDENNKIINDIIKFKEYNNKNELIYYDKQLYYSCLDELLFDLENLSLNNEQNKKLTSGGYILEYDNTLYILNTYIYQKISDMLPNYNNINKCYLELYKNDNLGFMINFMTPYSTEIIKRVNTSIKIISKEILNIYHLTRKKSNGELYNKLSVNYKKILFDLHKIFITTRQNEEIVDDFLGDKKSINNDIIYKYLKKINFDTLLSIYNDRDALYEYLKNNEINIITNDLHNIHPKILFMDCINTKTMCHLLKL